MPLRRKAPEDALSDAPKDRTWPTRLAWAVLIGSFGLVVTRASIATVVRIHGEGMAPTLRDGDAVLLLRSSRSVEAGDIVVYDPTPMPLAPDLEDEELPRTPGDPGARGMADANADARSNLHNTAVVDVEAVERRFERMGAQSGKAPATAAPTSYRLGRVLAVPGDAVTFNVPNAALGLAINGVAIPSEVGAPMRDVDEQTRTMRPTATEHTSQDGSELSYRVLVSTQAVTWEGMQLPFEDNPLQIRAEGYLIVADNRDESRCCDSRALGWIAPERVRGEVAARISARAPSTQDESDTRRVQWLP